MERNLRFLAVLVFVVWVVYAANGLVEVLAALARGFDVLSGLLSLVRGLPLLIAALALGASARRVTRWILPIPKSGCPRCGYRLIALAEPRCPECGLDLPREMVERA
jgi:hypothetical protein